jgi:hypothetical protein
MDGGPFRAQQPADRRVISRPERRQPEEPQQVAVEPPKPLAVHHTGTGRAAVKEKKSFKRFLWPILVAVIVLVAVGGWFAWSSMNGGAVAIDGSKYQAVFFSNGQVYFGKLHASNGDYMKLTDIYYLQSQQATNDKDSNNPQESSTNQNNVQLVKLGDEIHGPEDEMVISKDQVLFYENLKSDGKVAQSIQKSKDK